MESRAALRELAEVTSSQWGLVTSAQASARGVGYMTLSRLADSGDLLRLSQGVYKDAGAPADEHLDLRSAWLASEPARLAWERLSDIPATAVVSGESASRLHGIGEFRAIRNEFTTPRRKQTQRADTHYRTRTLTRDDVTLREGLPVTTVERTIADLVEDRQDLSLVGHALRDAARTSRLDADRLTELLSPLAERNGHRKGDGGALLDELREIAAIDTESVAKQIAAIPPLGASVAANVLTALPAMTILDDPGLRAALDVIARIQADILTPAVTEALKASLLPQLDEGLLGVPTIPSSTLAQIQSAVAAAVPQGLRMSLDAISAPAIQAAIAAATPLLDTPVPLAHMLDAIDAAEIAQSAQAHSQAGQRDDS